MGLIGKVKTFEAGMLRPIAVVIGNEGKGMSRLVKERVDGMYLFLW